MNQTILALCALVVAMTFSFNARALMHRGEQALQRTEVESVLATTADELFDTLAEKPFDANTAATTVTDLTLPNQFGGRTWQTAADLDDFDGASVTLQRTVGDTTMPVTVTAQVRYVQKSGAAFVDASNRQFYKRVRLTLTGPLDASATLERVYALAGV